MDLFSLMTGLNSAFNLALAPLDSSMSSAICLSNFSVKLAISSLEAATSPPFEALISANLEAYFAFSSESFCIPGAWYNRTADTAAGHTAQFAAGWFRPFGSATAISEE